MGGGQFDMTFDIFLVLNSEKCQIFFHGIFFMINCMNSLSPMGFMATIKYILLQIFVTTNDSTGIRTITTKFALLKYPCLLLQKCIPFYCKKCHISDIFLVQNSKKMSG